MSESKLIQYKKTKFGQDKKGRQTATYYLTQEQAAVVAEELQAHLGNERGVKLSFHTEEKETPWGAVEPSTFGFVNAIEAPGQGFAGRGGGGKGKFVPKAKAAAPTKAASTLNTEIE